MIKLGDYIIKFMHEPNEIGITDTYKLPYKGLTGCVLRANSDSRLADRIISIGWAYCSISDQFSRREGRKVSFTKAISILPKNVRGELWAEYRRLGL